MKKGKKLSPIVGILLVIVLAGYVYVMAGARKIEKLMWNHLWAGGYQQEDIKNLDIYHSFVNLLFSHNEWEARVRYADEPEVVYLYTVRDGQIKKTGVSGSVDDKDLKHKE